MVYFLYRLFLRNKNLKIMPKLSLKPNQTKKPAISML